MPIALPLIIAFAFFTFGLTGFGSGLVAMPLLVPLLGVSVAAPLFACISLTGETLMLARHRRSLNVGGVWRLALSSVVMIPLGAALAHSADERVVLLLLGLVTAGYGVYGLLNLRLPRLANPNWALVFGALCGLLSGAYNTGGPPLVIYGSMAGWTPAEFKSGLPGVFLLNSITVVTTHALGGRITPFVGVGYLIALPALLVGLLVGWRLERYIDPALFRRLVLVLLVGVGLRLVWAAANLG
jgi:uncharacterized membrane protein YfcA